MEKLSLTLENPYPPLGWNDITAFKYESPLRLYRDIKAVKGRGGEDADYVVSEPYVVSYRLDGGPVQRIEVPKGMLTDLSSVPRAARVIVGRVGPHLEASIVHDFLYIAWQDVPGRPAKAEDKVFADKLMRAAMRAAKVDKTQVEIIYQAVRLFGRPAYFNEDENRYVKVPE